MFDEHAVSVSNLARSPWAAAPASTTRSEPASGTPRRTFTDSPPPPGASRRVKRESKAGEVRPFSCPVETRSSESELHSERLTLDGQAVDVSVYKARWPFRVSITGMLRPGGAAGGGPEQSLNWVHLRRQSVEALGAGSDDRELAKRLVRLVRLEAGAGEEGPALALDLDAAARAHPARSTGPAARRVQREAFFATAAAAGVGAGAGEGEGEGVVVAAGGLGSLRRSPEEEMLAEELRLLKLRRDAGARGGVYVPTEMLILSDLRAVDGDFQLHSKVALERRSNCTATHWQRAPGHREPH